MIEQNADLHIHTDKTKESPLLPKHSLLEVLQKARELGLSAISVTDHGAIHDYKESQEMADGEGVILIPGQEVRAQVPESMRRRFGSLFGHPQGIIEFNIYGFPDLIQDEVFLPDQLVEIVHKKGGKVCLNHPAFTTASPVGVNLLNPEVTKYIEDIGIDMIEINSRMGKFNFMAKNLAQQLGRPLIGSSDARSLRDIGSTFTVFNSELPLKTWEDFIREMKEGSMSVGQRPTRFGPNFMGKLWKLE